MATSAKLDKEKAPLDLETIIRLKPARVFKGAIESSLTPPSTPPQGPSQNRTPPPTLPLHITGTSFDDTGEVFVTAAEDETFRLYDCRTGKHKKTLLSKKYGITLPRFTHKNSSIIYASTKVDHTIRYHSLHDNKYLQYFKGHEKKVVSLDMSPVSDGFLSASEDKTVRLWDLRTPTARGELSGLPHTPLAAYDSNGVVFAVGLNSYQRINLYDTRNFDKEPFLHIQIVDRALELISFPPRLPLMTSLSFSSNGKLLLVGTAGNVHYVVDAFDGVLFLRLVGFEGLEPGKSGREGGMTPTRGLSGEEVCWTPDSKFVIGGSLDGKVHVWDLSSDNKIPRLGPGEDPVTLQPAYTMEGSPSVTRCVKFNPRYQMMATAGAELAFWLPDNGNEDGKPKAAP
ncbi:WD40 repeat-like protein [Clavulina sp. PMI_390]|nr:WD40 repeat-like protein [Clavulina sp. PMI_390]